MPQNFTLDDTHHAFVFSSDWLVEPSEDFNFLQGTYHASQTPSETCTIKLTFNGTGVWFYGSKGPNHGSYSVQVDNTVHLYDARADYPQFRQLLFASNGLSIGPHEVTLTNTAADPTRVWLDFDYGIIEVEGGGDLNTAGGSFATTFHPESVASTATVPFNPVISTTSTPSFGSDSGRNGKSNSLSTILAIVFGALLALLVGILIVRFCIARRARRIRHREREFRLGPSTSPGPPLSPSPSDSPSPSMAQYARAPANPPVSPGINSGRQSRHLRNSVVPKWAGVPTIRIGSPPTRYSRHLPNTAATATMVAYRQHSQYLEPNSPLYSTHNANIASRGSTSPTSPVYLNDRPDHRHSLDFLSVRS